MKIYPLTKQDQELIKKAKALASTRETPGGPIGEVGSVLRTRTGKIFIGISLSLSCGIGFCGEHSAVADMVSHSKETEIETIVACSDSKKNPVLPPCGRCRELMNLIDKRNHKRTFVIISLKEKVLLSDLLPVNWLESEGGLK